MMLTVQEFVTYNENKLIAEISELKSQVEDLNEELGNVLDVKNRLVWELKFANEHIDRLIAKQTEKRHHLQTEDTED